MTLTFDPTQPVAAAATEVTEEKAYVASQWQLMWWRFRRHHLAMVGTIVIIIIYVVGIFCEFLAPYDPGVFERNYTFVPPQPIRIFHEGELHRPFIYGLERTRDPATYLITYEPDLAQIYPIQFWVQGDSYKMWGLWETTTHLFGLDPAVDHEGLRIHLLGTDRLGRDMFSRIVYGTRISLSIGLIGVFIQFVIGITLGGISGYFGGVIDLVIQRLIEFLMSLPTIPLWMRLRPAQCQSVGADRH